ncbi:hypothetical protein PNI0006_02285 [Streptococcus pneumoniae PNI0006]|nr:hypothetical protein PNI0006_02285 [Streptococcus pneumoniae PNI0006]
MKQEQDKRTFCAIFFSFRFTIGLNTFIVSRLEFFWYNLRRAPA